MDQAVCTYLISMVLIYHKQLLHLFFFKVKGVFQISKFQTEEVKLLYKLICTVHIYIIIWVHYINMYLGNFKLITFYNFSYFYRIFFLLIGTFIICILMVHDVPQIFENKK